METKGRLDGTGDGLHSHCPHSSTYCSLWLATHSVLCCAVQDLVTSLQWHSPRINRYCSLWLAAHHVLCCVLFRT